MRKVNSGIKAVILAALVGFVSPAYAGDDDKDKDFERVLESVQQLQLQVAALELKVATLTALTPPPIVKTTATTIMSNGQVLGSLVAQVQTSTGLQFKGKTVTGVDFTITPKGKYITDTYRVGFVTPDCSAETYFMPVPPLPLGTKKRFSDISGNEYESLGSGTYTFTRSEYDRFGNCVQTNLKVMQDAQRAVRASNYLVIPPVSIQ